MDLDALGVGIVAALQARGWKGPNASGEMTGLCPEAGHEARRASATWNVEIGGGRCHACSATWNILAMAELLGIDAQRYSEHGPRPSWNGRHGAQGEARLPDLGAWLASRGLPPETAKRWGLRAAVHQGRPAIRFPTAVGLDRIKFTDGGEPKINCSGRTAPCVSVSGRINEDGHLEPVNSSTSLDDFWPWPVCNQMCAGGTRRCRLVELRMNSENHSLSTCYGGNEDHATAPCFRDTDHHLSIADEIAGSGWKFAGISLTQDPVADDPSLFTQAQHMSLSCDTTDGFVMLARTPHYVPFSAFVENDGCASFFDASTCFANWFLE